MADEEKSNLKALTPEKIAARKKKSGHKCCAAAKCTFRSDNRPDLSFHEFPRDGDLKKKWEVAMRRGDSSFKSIKNKSCCSAHFLPSDFKDSLTGHRRELKKGVIPSVFDWKSATTERGDRLKLRTEAIATQKRQETVQSLAVAGTSRMVSVGSSKGSPTESCLTDNKLAYFGPRTLEEFISETKEDSENMKVELARAKEKEHIFKFGLERFSGSRDDINFYTGFPDYDTLIEFWKYIEPNASRLTYYSYVRETTEVNLENKFPYLNATTRKFDSSIRRVGAQRSLQPIDEFWLFLTRVRLGLFERDLAFRFNISVTTVSDIMITWSNYLYLILGSLPTWASREVIKQHLPQAFKGRFDNIRCIIDCTEIKCEKPQDLEKQSELYSEYKSHNTYKGLVGISPNVWVTFVSTLYGGSISDREIVEKSQFVDLLDPTDLIMADRGFDIQDMLANKRVKLFIPPKRQSVADQFSKEDCFETMRIANLRIHVERAIRRVKGWHIFDQVLPLSMNGVVNQMWTVCCLLVNWQKPALTC